MGAVMFYHLTQRPLTDTLRMLIEKSLTAGWRVSVRGTDPAGLEALDAALWLGGEDSFLPHGIAGGAHDGLQPVLLGTDGSNANNAQCLMAVHSAPITAQDAAAMERVCILFDGYDEEQLNHARGQWKTLTGAGVSAQYWSEESGRWEKKAEA
ncbi:DNA polymerase III subunit chi [Sulfitobacter guttiformis]|uniref:DNA polymerase III chi subunit n=1 Tax=Sulfitobacter guttiformis TaxID=74349 RepID=A0A420DMU0_9RHOB|nr:DNA polymerase III subunit chi [Sulfitobacter guttiformis]KIN72806.1 DNA polymerase III subunit chi [Sulfitobacter guttiformis KCTC 32187]RKE95498.1 DNA polymerase III chi subunit [Sulfitobacter guttiformis]